MNETTRFKHKTKTESHTKNHVNMHNIIIHRRVYVASQRALA